MCLYSCAALLHSRFTASPRYNVSSGQWYPRTALQRGIVPNLAHLRVEIFDYLLRRLKHAHSILVHSALHRVQTIQLRKHVQTELRLPDRRRERVIRAADLLT